MHAYQVSYPSPYEVFFLLSKYNTAVLNARASQLDEMPVIGADYTPHLYSPIQLLLIAFTKASQVSYRQDINTAAHQLTGDFDI